MDSADKPRNLVLARNGEQLSTDPNLSYYQKHVLICTNQKIPGKTCCAHSGGQVFFDYMKTKLLELALHGPGKIRVSQSGCLGRCSLGPCLVIYPEAIWYTYSSFDDLDKIIQSHLIENKRVDSLVLDPRLDPRLRGDSP